MKFYNKKRKIDVEKLWKIYINYIFKKKALYHNKKIEIHPSIFNIIWVTYYATILKLINPIICSFKCIFNLIRNVKGDRYVIETDGLLIKQISKSDGGTYTCRARVPQTGELEERNIILDVSFHMMYKPDIIMLLKVQEPPSWVLKPSDVQGIESEKAEFKCQALGSPSPKYTWVDREGNAATDKEGCVFLTIL